MEKKGVPQKTTSSDAAKKASETFKGLLISKKAKSAARIALSQSKALKKVISANVAKKISKILKDSRNGRLSKIAAKRAFYQQEIKKTNGTGPRKNL